MELDDLDKQLLNEIQKPLPYSSEPFDVIAQKLNSSVELIMEKLNHFKQTGILRQLSAIFDTRKLGYRSSLVAVEVEYDKLTDVAAIINKHPGVSHNYERENKFNLWFTIATPPGSNLKSEVDRFATLPGVKKIRMLPTVKMFKIGVKLDMGGNQKQEIKPTEKKKEIQNVKFVASDEDKKFIRELQKNMDISQKPFSKIATNLGISEQELFEKMQYYEKIGVMRRFAAILRHRDAGFLANGMIVWKVPENRIDEVGNSLGSFPQVTHCYQRPSYDDWPYNVFSMIHCKTKDEAFEVAKIIQKEINVDEFTILFSTKEFKKTRVQYFEEQNFVIDDLLTA